MACFGCEGTSCTKSSSRSSGDNELKGFMLLYIQVVAEKSKEFHKILILPFSFELYVDGS